MTVIRQVDCQVARDSITFFGSAYGQRVLPFDGLHLAQWTVARDDTSSQGHERPIFPAGGMLVIEVESLDMHGRMHSHVHHGKIDQHDLDPVSFSVTCVPVLVELISERNGQQTVVKAWKTMDRQVDFDTGTVNRFTWSMPATQPKLLPDVRWSVRVSNKVDGRKRTASCLVGMRYERGIQPIQSHPVAIELVNRGLGLVVQALALRGSVKGRTASVSFGPEIPQAFSELSSSIFGNHRIDLPFPEGIQADEGEIFCPEIEMTSGLAFRRFFAERVNMLLPVFAGLGEVDTGSGGDAAKSLREAMARLQGAVMAKLASKPPETPDQIRAETAALRADILQRVGLMVGEEDVVLRFSLGISKTSGQYDLSGLSLGLGGLTAFTLTVFLVFDRTCSGATVWVHAPTDTHGLASVASWFANIPDEIAGAIANAVMPKMPVVARYLAEALLKMVDQNSVFVDAKVPVGGDTLLVRSAWIPRYPELVPSGGPAPHRPPGEPAGPGGGLGNSPAGGGTNAPPPLAPPPPPPTGTLPDGFLVGDPQTLRQLDRIETMVFVMKENRSFDHMLGYLSRLRPGNPDRYDGVTLGAANSADGNVYAMAYAYDVIDPPCTRMRVSPEHNYEAVCLEINDGAMDGFAAVAADLKHMDPQAVMTYYTDKELPVYYALAERFTVCQRWFSAHPGPTWPNRWATASGRIPDVNNFPSTDARLGYLRDVTVFNILDAAGIDWMLFEQNISILRTYDRYRLENRRIRPYAEYFDRARQGTLPPVVFIEPRFVDIPPAELATCDQAPADLRHGQRFVGEVYDALSKSPQWSRSLLLLTYDEHGGFYDHVPPPGTPHGPPELRDAYPPLCEGGPRHLGARVPTLVVSPFVKAGGASNIIFDHTSIPKTILLRHRARLTAEQLMSLGPRVAQANHLGMLLTVPGATPTFAPLDMGAMGLKPLAARVAPVTATRGLVPQGVANPKETAAWPLPRGLVY
jgi:phospholipase C